MISLATRNKGWSPESLQAAVSQPRCSLDTNTHDYGRNVIMCVMFQSFTRNDSFLYFNERVPRRLTPGHIFLLFFPSQALLGERLERLSVWFGVLEIECTGFGFGCVEQRKISTTLSRSSS